MLKFYLAGPGVFLKNPHQHAALLKDVCRDNGVQGLFPLDNDLDLADLPKAEQAQKIYHANIEMIHTCDGVLADMRAFRGPGMDGGTAFEMGYATALSKPVVGYGSTGTYLERAIKMTGPLKAEGGDFYDENDLLVEDFALVDNLMMACSLTAFEKIFEIAVQRLKAHCEQDL